MGTTQQLLHHHVLAKHGFVIHNNRVRHSGSLMVRCCLPEQHCSCCTTQYAPLNMIAHPPTTLPTTPPSTPPTQPGAREGMLLLLAACEAADGGWGVGSDPPGCPAPTVTTRRAAAVQRGYGGGVWWLGRGHGGGAVVIVVVVVVVKHRCAWHMFKHMLVDNPPHVLPLTQVGLLGHTHLFTHRAGLTTTHDHWTMHTCTCCTTPWCAYY